MPHFRSKPALFRAAIAAGYILFSIPVAASAIDVVVSGNLACSSSEIKSVVDSAGCNLGDSSCVDLICKRIIEHYLGLGYLDAVVTCEALGDTIKVAIDEGDRSVLGFVLLEGIPVSDSSLVYGCFERLYGKPIDTAELEKCIQKVLMFYDRNGYPLARISPTGVIRDGMKIGLRFGFDQGPRARIKQVIFSGLKNTRAKSLFRRIGFSPGMDYDGSKIDCWRNRLLATGVFESVSSPKLIFSRSDSTLTVGFDLAESRGTRIEGAGGYAPFGKTKAFVGSITLDMRNIAGTLRQSRILWNKPAPQRLKWQIEYREPTVVLSHLSAEISVGSDVEDTLYADRRMRALLVWQSEGNIEAGIGFVLASTKDRSLDIREGDFAERGMVFSLKMGGRGIGSRDDDKFDAKINGVLSRISYSQDKPSKTIWEIDANMRQLKRLGSALAIGLELGYHQVYASQGNLPYARKVRAGGVGSIRGYAEDIFLVDRLIRLSVEPGVVLGNLSRAYGFIDLALLDGSGYSLTDLKSQPFGYGIGLIAASGIGAVRIDIGVGRVGGWDQARLHFSLVGSF